MRRYWLFAHNNYYARGGLQDFIDSFDTLEEAAEKVRSLEAHCTGSKAHLLDSENPQEVHHWYGQKDPETEQSEWTPAPKAASAHWLVPKGQIVE